MADAAEVAAALLAQRTTLRERLHARAELAALSVLAEFEDWYSTAAITEMTRQIVAYVEAAQAQAASLTDAYLIEVASQLAPRRTFRPAPQANPATLRTGTTHQGVYGRLADQYRYQSSLGTPEATILAGVTDRAKAMVATDIQLAQRAQSARWMDTNGVDEWRRVIRPELAKEGTCGLCIVASDRTYFRADLLPIHDRCGCDTLPIIGDQDPGRALNREDLDRLYAEAGSTYAADLKGVRVQVTEHGELGPVLVNRNHTVRDAATAAADRTH